MRRSIECLLPTLAAALLLAACGGSSSNKGSSAAAQTQPAATQTGASGSAAVVRTAPNAKLGATVLVDSQGRTLYHLSGEQGGKFICSSSACTQVWHPLILPASATPSGTVASLATVKRPDGGVQITYKGMPLYTFAQDTASGQANGQGLKDVGTWAAVTVSAGSGGATSGPQGTSTETSGGGRYGY